MTSKAEIRRKILTYSLVSARISEDADPIAALEPFFAPIAADQNGRLFDTAEFRGDMSSRYGMIFSRDVTEVFVTRLLDLGFLRRADGKLTWSAKSIELPSEADGEAFLDRVLASARDVISNQENLLKLKFDEGSFLSALLAVILDQNTAVQEAVRAIAKADGENSESDLNFSIEDSWQWAAAEFVAWAQKNDKEIFEWLADLSGTALVTEALVDIRTPSQNQHIRPELTVYLDGPFLMELLGTSGEAARKDAKYIVSALSKLRIPVAVFSHSIDELVVNLKAVLRASPRERRGPTATALLLKEVQETVLSSIVMNPEHFVRQEGLSIVPTDSGRAINRSYFSEEREQQLYASFYSHYENEPARERDVRSITWVICRRAGEIRTDVLKAKHILVTRNDKLVSMVGNFCRTQLSYRANAVLPVITVRDLAGVLWLLLGNAERGELSHRQILLSCQRARAAAPTVVSKMAKVLAGVNEANAELLWAAAQQPKYLSMAMAVAFSTGHTDEKSAEEVLNAVKDDLIADEKKLNASKQKELIEKHESEAAMLRLIQEKVVQENDKLARENAEILASLQSVSQELWSGARARYELASKALSWAGNLIVLIATLTPIFVGDAFGTGASGKILSGVLALVALYGGNVFAFPALKRLIAGRLYSSYERRIVDIAPGRVEQVLIARPFDMKDNGE